MVEKAVPAQAERAVAGPVPRKRRENKAAAGEFFMHLQFAAHRPAKRARDEADTVKGRCEKATHSMPVLCVLDGVAAPVPDGSRVAAANTRAEGAPVIQAATAAGIAPALAVPQDAGPLPPAAAQVPYIPSSPADTGIPATDAGTPAAATSVPVTDTGIPVTDSRIPVNAARTPVTYGDISPAGEKGAQPKDEHPYHAESATPQTGPEPAGVTPEDVMPFAVKDTQAGKAAFAADFAGGPPVTGKDAQARPEGAPDMAAATPDKAADFGEGPVYHITESISAPDVPTQPAARGQNGAEEAVFTARQGHAEKSDMPAGPQLRIVAADEESAGEKGAALRNKAGDADNTPHKNDVPINDATPFKVYSGRENAITEAIKGEDAVFQVARSILEKAPLRKTTFAVELWPEELGRVTVKLDSVDGKLTLRLAAENAETSKLLAENVEQLKSALTDRRVEVVRIDIDTGYAPHSLADFSGSFGQAQREKETASPTRRTRVYHTENDAQNPGEDTGAVIYERNRLLNYLV